MRRALQREGVGTFISRKKNELKEADAVVLPGVGGFRAAAKGIPREALRELATSGKLVIGVCLGIQFFLESSEEGPGRGLALLPGVVKRLPSTVKVPHTGWNTLILKKDTELTEGLPETSWVYFVHSYYPKTRGDWVVATTRYGVEFPSLLSKRNIVGAQFHPEKSGPVGSTILRNIVRMAR